MRIKIVLLVLIATISPSLLMAQEGSVKGTITDRITGNALPGVTISLNGKEVGRNSNEDGSFSILLPVGEHLLSFDISSYDQALRQVNVKDGETTDLGTVSMLPRQDIRQDAVVISLTDSDEDGGMDSQGYQGILSSSADVFESAAAYTFGPVRFKTRGYDADYQGVMINGFFINDPETGNPIWSDWGGLNDVMRNTVVTNGPEATGHMFEPVGGLTRIITEASLYRPGTKLVYSATNRTYRNRIMATYSTGLTEKGWAFTGSASRRWSQEGFVEGTFYDAWSIFLAAEKRINENHTLNFTALDAIYNRGVGGGSVQEAYDLTGNNYYNPYWGYQNGEKRNSRVRSSNKPLLTLLHKWNIGDNTDINTSAGYWFGRSGYSALNWYDAPDPRPDYYRYLPSYYTDPADQQRITEGWNDPSVSQLNWDHFYFSNRKNYYEVSDAEGIAGNTITGNRSKYIIEDRREDLNQFQFNSTINHSFGEKLKFAGGIMINLSRGHNYNAVKDLLGGDYWLDIDQFAERDYPDDPLIITNDLNNPNNVVRVGDTYSHSYISNQNQSTAWGQINYTAGKLNLYFQASGQSTSLWREGLMKKGLFPDNSYGDSEKLSFLNWGAKTGGEYRITGRHMVKYNALYMERPPLFNSSFLSPRTRNEVTPGINPERILSADLSYIMQTPSINARLTAYYTRFFDQAEVTSFYHEELRTFINYSVTGIEKEHMGVELGFEWDITSTLSVNTVAALGQYLWMNNPNILITRDNSSEVVRNDEVWIQYFRVEGTPQTALSAGISYNSPKYWWAGITGSYFDHIYIDFNPVTRTKDETGFYPYWDIMQKQPKGYLLDAFIGKSWYLGDYYVVISANVSNITNRRNFITGGFEQYRYDPERPDLFAPKYYYYYGFNYFLNASVRF